MASSSQVIEISPILQRLLHDASAHQIPELLISKSPTQLAERERELQTTLKRIDAELDNFLMDCTDAGNNTNERAAWSDALQRAQKQVTATRKEVQSALIKARQEVRMKARNALFEDMAESKEERERRRKADLADRSAEDKLMTASGDVTSALQRAVTMMSIELEKSSYSSQLLDESSMSIQRATIEYSSFTSLVASSTKLIKSMERADFYDAIMLSLSFLFFMGCIAYIVKVRIWDKGVGLISFFLRLGGLSASRSAGDVKEKLRLAKEAAKELQSSKAAEMAKTAIVNTVASIATAAYPPGHTVQAPDTSSIEADHTQFNSPDRIHDEL